MIIMATVGGPDDVGQMITKGRLFTASVAVLIAGCDRGGAMVNNGAGGRGGIAAGSGGGGAGGNVNAAGSGGQEGGANGSIAGKGGTGAAGGISGGGGTGGSPDGDPAAAEACAALSKALCARTETCTPFVVGLFFGSRTVCEQRLALDCLPKFGAPGTSATPAKTSICADSLATHPCTAFAKGDFGAACAPEAGSLAAGVACGDDAQCASTFCARAPDAVCGVCAPTTQAGSPCVRGACSAGTVCPMGKSSCVALEPGQLGATCTIQEQCDVGNGVGCSTVSGRCIRLTLGSTTGTCGADVAGSMYTACMASGTCSKLLGGTCTMTAADGAACSTASSGPACLPPARCVGGRCTLPDPG